MGIVPGLRKKLAGAQKVLFVSSLHGTLVPSLGCSIRSQHNDGSRCDVYDYGLRDTSHMLNFKLCWHDLLV